MSSHSSGNVSETALYPNLTLSKLFPGPGSLVAPGISMGRN